MKKIIFLAFLAFTSASFQAQEKVKMDAKSSDFNKLTVEITTGQAKGIAPMTEGYYIQNKFGTIIVNSFNVGGRYMLNPIFGTKLDFGYYKLNNNPQPNESKVFNLSGFTVGLQGVVNTSNLFDISNEMGKFNMLIHGGFQISKLNSDNPGLAKKDNNLGVMLGFSPQFRLCNKVSLIADVTILKNFKQFYTWDGNLADRSGNQAGLMVYTSLGLTYSIGKNKLHGDWAKNNSTSDQIEDLQKRIQNLETQNKK